VLGPAHRAYQAHSVERNRDKWSRWDWHTLGEEWTQSAEWKRALVAQVLRPTMPPGGTLLEIGPGAGRWTSDRAVISSVADAICGQIHCPLCGESTSATGSGCRCIGRELGGATGTRA
jgi:hypothetical protein